MAKWKKRKLERRYVVVMLEGMFVSVRRDTVETEVVLVIVGIDENGIREVLDFEVRPAECAKAWEELIARLKERGVEEVLLFVADGVAGLEEVIKRYFPRADFQVCALHKVRRTLTRIGRKDREEFLGDLKGVYRALTVEEAKRAFERLKKR